MRKKIDPPPAQLSAKPPTQRERIIKMEKREKIRAREHRIEGAR